MSASPWQPSALGQNVTRAIASQRLLGATFLLAVSLATVGQTRGGLPAPRRYAAVALLWFVFGLAAELGGQVARFVGALAALVVLGMAMGTAGRRALAWLTGVAGTLEPVGSDTYDPDPAAVRAAGQGRGGVFTPRPRPSATTPATASGGGGGGGW